MDAALSSGGSAAFSSRCSGQARELIKSFEEKKTKKKTGTSSRNNKFLNIEKSEIDYDSIAQKRVLDRMKNGTHECTV